MLVYVATVVDDEGDTVDGGVFSTIEAFSAWINRKYVAEAQEGWSATVTSHYIDHPDCEGVMH